MSTTLDFSNYEQNLLEFSFTQFENTKILNLNQNNLVLKDDYKNITKQELLEDEYFIMNFWIKFSIAFETLLKVILIKYEISGVFKNSKKFEECKTERNSIAMKDLQNCIKSNFPDDKIIDAVVINNKCYTIEDCFKQGIKVSVTNNNWLKEQFEEKNFVYLKQINTCTLGDIPNLLDDILNQYLPNDKDEIKYQIIHFTKLRRNREMHMYFKNQILVDNKDLYDYIETINKLLKLI